MYEKDKYALSSSLTFAFRVKKTKRRLICLIFPQICISYWIKLCELAGSYLLVIKIQNGF